jgi:hypothetical protein
VLYQQTQAVSPHLLPLRQIGSLLSRLCPLCLRALVVAVKCQQNLGIVRADASVTTRRPPALPRWP